MIGALKSGWFLVQFVVLVFVYQACEYVRRKWYGEEYETYFD